MTSPKGFTLIELLITITIATTLATFGFSAYSKSQKLQLIKSATRQVISLLDSTHKLSLIGTRPDDCTGSFQGYQLSTTALENTIVTTPLCNTTSSTPTTHTISNISFTDTTSFIFRPLVSGVDLGGSDTLNLDYLDSNGETHRIIISKSGDYNYQGIVQ